MQNSAPFIHNQSSVTKTMFLVVCAMLPAWFFWLFSFGWFVLYQTVLIIATAALTEAVMLRVRNKSTKYYLKDLSFLITALIIVFSLPPNAPWWIGIIAVISSLTIGKHLFGGIGYNPFNPAMVGYAIILVSFPLELSLWPDPALLSQQTWMQALNAFITSQQSISMSAATPLDILRNNIGNGGVSKAFFLNFWYLLNLLFIAGGMLLIALRVISWHIPFSVIATLLIFTLLFGSNTNPLDHLFFGATMICAFIIATDPVSCATSKIGKLIFGFIIGALIFILRTWGNYPDAVAFAILIANLSTPLIDRYTIPRIYGT